MTATPFAHWGAGLVLMLAACSAPPPPPVAAGQTWMVASQRGAGAASTTILAIEPSTPLGTVAFVIVSNMNLTLADGTRRSKLGPMAITMDALRASLREFQFHQGPDVRYAGYVEQWRMQAAQGRAEAFTYSVPIEQALDAFEHGQVLPAMLGASAQGSTSSGP